MIFLNKNNSKKESMTNEEFVHTIFPKNKNDNEELQPRPDCEMMYKELQKPGVTRTLLWC